jgi:hypothetical protein
MLAAFACGTLAAQNLDFQTTLYPILEKANCRACHNAEGVASATRLHFPERDSSPEKIAAFGNSLVVLVDREHPDNSLLFKKPTARIPHTGGQRIKPESQEEMVLKAWIARLTQLSGDRAQIPGTRERRQKYYCAGKRTPPPDAQPIQSHGP